MHAEVGDWLVVKTHGDSERVRHGMIRTVHPGGEPPYTVRWTDQERETTVFPGPDATVISAERQIELDRARTTRVTALQKAMLPAGETAG